jgi:single-stranded DNA-specific DHH superfamily exonuclease
MGVKKDTMLIRLEPKLKSRIEKVAKHKDIPSSELVRRYLNEGVMSDEKKIHDEMFVIKYELENVRERIETLLNKIKEANEKKDYIEVAILDEQLKSAYYLEEMLRNKLK